MADTPIVPRFDPMVRVATGPMGKVYRAWDRERACFVALKTPTIRMRERFRREIALLATLDHPHIVRYVAHGIGRLGVPWLATEWLEGEPLDKRLARGTLTVRELLRVATPVASALGWAHARGIVHRDVKPENLFLEGGHLDCVKVLDFGLARPACFDTELTTTGTYMGTFEYMPPEQTVDAKRADARSDVFSLGAVVFHCLTGRPPRDGGRGFDVPALRTFRSDVSGDLEDLVRRMLSIDPSARPASAAAVVEALERMNCGWEDETVRMAPPRCGPSGTQVMDRPTI